MRSDDEGYTLTEMLVVIAIIALLAAVLTPSLMGQMARARVKAAKLQLQTVASAVDSYRADVGRAPTVNEGLSALIGRPEGVEGWLGPYLQDASTLKDPWGRAIQYSVDDDGFEIKSLGADGKPGGDSVAADITMR
jgi:general secretion pathway protein G